MTSLVCRAARSWNLPSRRKNLQTTETHGSPVIIRQYYNVLAFRNLTYFSQRPRTSAHCMLPGTRRLDNLQTTALMKKQILSLSFILAFSAISATGQTFFFSTGDPDGLMAMASRPASPGKFEVESADDFVTRAQQTHITSATFTGLIPAGVSVSDIGQVQVEIYRVFPNDSDVGRTSGPPTFSTSQVPTRVNSPSDVAFESRSSLSGGGLSFTTSLLIPPFTAGNSVAPGGIHPFPNQTTGGDGPITGQEIQFTINFTTPFSLPADHYFFVPQVELTSSGNDFFGFPRPDRSFLRELHFRQVLQICRHGLVMRILTRIGCGSAQILLVVLFRQPSTDRFL